MKLSNDMAVFLCIMFAFISVTAAIISHRGC